MLSITWPEAIRVRDIMMVTYNVSVSCLAASETFSNMLVNSISFDQSV